MSESVRTVLATLLLCTGGFATLASLISGYPRLPASRVRHILQNMAIGVGILLVAYAVYCGLATYAPRSAEPASPFVQQTEALLVFLPAVLVWGVACLITLLTDVAFAALTTRAVRPYGSSIGLVLLGLFVLMIR